MSALSQRILDAAAQIAGERGYEGTSINLVSERSGLPASSIYWHFKDKDELIAAVIDQSFQRWNEELARPIALPDGTTADEVFHLGLRHSGVALARFPDFLRLGLLLILEQRPESNLIGSPQPLHGGASRDCKGDRGPTAQADRLPDLDESARGQLVTLTMALADGLFIAGDAGEVDLDDAFDLLATAVLATARTLQPG